MPVDRLLPSDEAHELIALTRDIADKGAQPHRRRQRTYAHLPARGVHRPRRCRTVEPALSPRMGWWRPALRGVPASARGDRPAVAVAVSVHSLACHPLAMFGTESQKQQWLPPMLSGAPPYGVPLASQNRAPVPCGRPALRRAPCRGRAGTRSAARKRGSPTAGSPASTPCSLAQAQGRKESLAFWFPATSTDSPTVHPKTRWDTGVAHAIAGSSQAEVVSKRRCGREPNRGQWRCTVTFSMSTAIAAKLWSAMPLASWR
jgi:hypothetical protein